MVKVPVDKNNGSISHTVYFALNGVLKIMRDLKRMFSYILTF